MERPSSRAGGAQAGIGARPMTSSLRAGLGGMPSNMMQPPIAQRPTTASRGGLDARPMSSASRGQYAPGAGGRQVQDRNYFLAELRGKAREVSLSVEKMQAELAGTERGQQTDVELEKLTRELRKLKGDNMMWNTILEKIVTGASADSLRQRVQRMESANGEEESKLKALIDERSALERRTKEMTLQLESQEREVEVVLNQLPPGKRNEYADLQSKRRELAEETTRLEKELDMASEARDKAKAEIDQDNTRARFHAIGRTLNELRAKKARSMELLQGLQRSPEEQKRAYMQRVREDNEALAQIEAETREVAEAVRAADGKLAGVRSDWSAQLGSEAADKLERLIKRDQELSERIGTFSAQSAANQEAVLQREGNIFRLLERTSRALAARESLPDRQRMRELEQELRYKQMQLGAAQTTASMLTGEQAQRQAELERARNAIPEMGAKIKAKRLEIENMKEGLVKFADLEGYKRELEAQKMQLDVELAWLRRAKDLRGAVEQKRVLADNKQRDLGRNTNHTQIEALLQKLSAVEQRLFEGNELVRGSEGEADTKPLVANLMAAADEINADIKRRCRQTA